ncbi:hypothetical protein BHE74_00039056 [Ensete ventricosum]|nr:hypothetical protein GW17_00054834 [Ensete ventricosum]RWW54367.1 hypothetical protein BHE74_00039056 [Ensete ventricosum]
MRGEYTSARPIRDPEQSSSISELLHSRRPPVRHTGGRLRRRGRGLPSPLGRRLLLARVRHHLAARVANGDKQSTKIQPNFTRKENFPNENESVVRRGERDRKAASRLPQ